jgi:ketosteroid isomerase-like protein
MEEILDPDYFHTNPDGSLMTRADTIESYRKPTQFSFSSEELDDVKTVIATSDSAIVNACVTLKGKRVDDPFISRYRVTYVRRRTRNGWKVLNSHSSLLSITTRN